VSLHFGQACVAVYPAAQTAAHLAAQPAVQSVTGRVGWTEAADGPSGRLELRDEASGRRYQVPLAPTIACDGAGSAVRASLARAGVVQSRESMLDHDYKELMIPAQHGDYALEREALHIWPRGGFMLIALPNADGSFTATLFLARDGSPGFSSLGDDESVRRFFAREFPDVLALMPDLLEEFRAHPQGRLGTVYVDPWHQAGELLLLGDAAHAIVPFHGQGMNCAFEDCSVLDALVGESAGWSEVFAAFARDRRPNTDAIAAMALENYLEMRDSVRDPGFVRQKRLALALERRFPERFVPRYSMVMFHPEIPYAEARRRGAIQQALLDELDAEAGPESDGALPADEKRLRERIESQLPALVHRDLVRATQGKAK
jgi:kynurenine 3-monooxygenase